MNNLQNNRGTQRGNRMDGFIFLFLILLLVMLLGLIVFYDYGMQSWLEWFRHIQPEISIHVD
ncbi:MAG: hypothetical protein EA362_11140 [Saprospirales bacterium]|nr:MAG: hypothetical protein EA362_11140 [Saprospirales bacterium]